MYHRGLAFSPCSTYRIPVGCQAFLLPLPCGLGAWLYRDLHLFFIGDALSVAHSIQLLQ